MSKHRYPITLRRVVLSILGSTIRALMVLHARLLMGERR